MTRIARKGRREYHGLLDLPEYQVWAQMRYRCLNPQNKGYKNYGGRGITVCDRWNNSFAAFLEDMGRRPSPSVSIDRINNNGNYEPSNCRWADRRVQSLNRRIARVVSSTGYLGVYADHGRYQVKITNNGKQLRLGWYDSPIIAAITYNKAAMCLHGRYAKLNRLPLLDMKRAPSLSRGASD